MKPEELFEQWVRQKLDAYTQERPAPKREDYPYQERYDSALWAWESCYQTRVSLYTSQREGFLAGLALKEKPQ